MELYEKNKIYMQAYHFLKSKVNHQRTGIYNMIVRDLSMKVADIGRADILYDIIDYQKCLSGHFRKAPEYRRDTMDF